MGRKIAKLIDVKSIVTLALTAAFIVLALRGTIVADQFMTVFTVVISFYFGTQVGKKEAKEEQEKETDENGENKG